MGARSHVGVIRIDPGRMKCARDRAGAKGYVTKSSPPDLLVRAVRDVAEGRLAICPEISEALAFDRVQEEKTRLHGLSPREFEILRMITAQNRPTRSLRHST